VLHEATVVLKVVFAEEPSVPEEARTDAAELAPGFWRVVLRYGFKEHPDVPAAVARLCAGQGLLAQADGPCPDSSVSYFLSRSLVAARPDRRMLPSPLGAGMSKGRLWVFAAMHRNASDAVDFYSITRPEAIELGAEVQI
jgi:KUP system potassium uptake protein